MGEPERARDGSVKAVNDAVPRRAKRVAWRVAGTYCDEASRAECWVWSRAATARAS